MERHVTFRCRELELEGLWTALPSTSAAIITHPHPLYGGDMHNTVVETIATAYENKGWSTLRFNFRGVGKSEGHFDNGIGEQEDVTSAIDFLSSKGISDIHLAGYSFGAWVLACRAREAHRAGIPMSFIAPPVGFIDFNPIQPIPGLRHVIVGSGDELAPLASCESIATRWNPQAKFDVLDGADHFFWNHMEALQEVLEERIPAIRN